MRVIEDRTNAAPRRIRRFEVLSAFAIATALLVLTSTSSSPDLATLLVLGVLTAVAEHRDRLFADETSMSGSIVVVLAAASVFGTEGAPVGALLCGMVAGLYWPHLRERALGKMVLNAFSVGFSGLAAAGLFWLADSTRQSLVFALISVTAVAVYWVFNSAALAAASTILGRGSFDRGFAELIRSEAEMIVFGVLGAFCGLLILDVNPWVGTGALVALLVVVDVLVIGRARPATVRMHHPGLAARVAQVASVSVGGGVAYLVTDAIGPVGGALAGVVAGSVLSFATAAGALRRRLGRFDLPLASGLVVADAALVLGGAGAGAAAVVGGPLAAFVVVTIAIAGDLVVRRLASRDAATDAVEPIDDIEALALLELALADRSATSPPA